MKTFSNCFKISNNSFTKKIYRNYSFKNRLGNFNIMRSIVTTKLYFSFCSVDRLDVDKLALSKLDEKPLELKLENKEKEFSIEDFIVEFNPQVNWEETVLKSEIPVVVDCYAL